MEVACDACNGTGTVNSQDGHPDICPMCMGLGTRTLEQMDESTEGFEKSLASRRPLIRAVYAFAAVMVVYYAVLIIGDAFYHFSLTAFIIILVVGHSVSVSGLVLYLLWVSFRKGQEY